VLLDRPVVLNEATDVVDDSTVREKFQELAIAQPSATRRDLIAGRGGGHGPEEKRRIFRARAGQAQGIGPLCAQDARVDNPTSR
jgi:hypothetical protein